MPCRCGMSDAESEDSLEASAYWEDIRSSVDGIIKVLLNPRRLDQIEMDESQAKSAFLKMVKHKLYGCDESRKWFEQNELTDWEIEEFRKLGTRMLEIYHKSSQNGSLRKIICGCDKNGYQDNLMFFQGTIEDGYAVQEFLNNRPRNTDTK